MAEGIHLDIDTVAQLARIALTDEEKQLFGRQLDEVLAHVRQLESIDVSDVEPMAHAFAVVNVWQEDEPEPPLPVAEALHNAPAVRDNMIVVPKVVDEA